MLIVITIGHLSYILMKFKNSSCKWNLHTHCASVTLRRWHFVGSIVDLDSNGKIFKQPKVGTV